MKGALLLSAFLLILLHVYSNAQEDCCAWPVSPYGTVATNITVQQFNCSQPISISCQNSGYGFIKVGIAGINGQGTTNFTVLAQDDLQLTKSFACRHHQWSMVGETNKYDRFACIFKKPNGDWIGF
ncbi:unnamed protein product [Caenorhabditis nigoni]